MTDQTITVTVKPEIDREAVEEAAQLAAALFLSSFAVAVLDGIADEEPPEDVLARVKEQTLEKAAQEGCEPDVVDAIDRQTAVIERALEPRRLIIPEGEWDGRMPTRLLWTSLPDVQPSEALQGAPTAANASEPAQTLADLTPCLGDRVRAYRCLGIIEDFTYGHHAVGGYGWSAWVGQSVVTDAWTVLEHLDPVTPEEPPVGAGMLVDVDRALWRRDEGGWRYLASTGKWSHLCLWSIMVNPGNGFDGYRLRPATPADLAEHGVDEQGESMGSEAVTAASVLYETADWLESMMPSEGSIGGPQSGYGQASLGIIRLIRERAAKGGAR